MQIRSKILAPLVLSLALALAPTASATPADDSFLDALDEQGITYPSPEYAIEAGYTVCEAMDVGMDWEDLVVQISDASDLSEESAAYLVGAAIAAYCPENWPEDVPASSGKTKIT